MHTNLYNYNYTYTLNDSYTPANFFSKFDFFTDRDPTNGFVDYVDIKTATDLELISAGESHVRIGIDNVTVIPEDSTVRGRKSVRISSKTAYERGLFLFDVDHIPTGCGTWPALWFLGDQSQGWPTFGEFDVIEGVNQQTYNIVSGHTLSGCSFPSPIQLANQQSSDCTSPGVSNIGCSSKMSSSTFGAPFNAAAGGIYALEWSSLGLKVWFHPRSTSVDTRNPRPSTWGTPAVSYLFSSLCGPTFFQRMNIIINLTFCGDFAGAADVYGASGCSSTCSSFVKRHPEGLDEAYWRIRSISVFN